MPEPNNNSNNNSGQGDQSGNAGNTGGGQSGGSSSAQNNQNGGGTQSGGTQSNVDLKALPADQIAAALENPALWETPRMKELLSSSKELKDLKDKASQDEESRLKEQKKFEELAEKKEQENLTLKSQMEQMRTNQALTSLLLKENVVDLDAALVLINRGSIKLNEDGTVTGADEAIKALKSDKTYLFNSQNGGANNQNLGTASNAGNQNQSSGQMKFKRSQLMGPDGTKFYQEHKTEIDEAYQKGLIEDDVTPRR